VQALVSALDRMREAMEAFNARAAQTDAEARPAANAEEA
jgi:hypothetical protein